MSIDLSLQLGEGERFIYEHNPKNGKPAEITRYKLAPIGRIEDNNYEILEEKIIQPSH